MERLEQKSVETESDSLLWVSENKIAFKRGLKAILLCRNKKKLLFKKLPFRDNGQHPKSCEKEKVGNIRIQKGRQVIVVHKEVQYQQCREHDYSDFFVEEHQDQSYHHQGIN